ncbi:hypothetical protein [Methylomicrobium sp. Wu6]|uniref:hypothetical protein n=1 Tax=Methylomicrobium sp. Wu6 TaxID=3107928 RepID=UPI002DD68B03|nr:hypothetical protein [Methylomicrobium sp. Wu6]MEC4746943.1 hypothetical protein [Methylomicrobium sp. Wu6]
MIKIYKKVIFNETVKQDHRLESPEQVACVKTRAFRVPDLIAIPVMVIAAVFGALVFSAFFALLLIPVAILAVRTWWIFRKLRQHPIDQSLDVEYTVISHTSKKDDLGVCRTFEAAVGKI